MSWELGLGRLGFSPHILRHMPAAPKLAPTTASVGGPVDVDAAVISNTRLSADYSVLALAAPKWHRSRGPASSSW